MSVIRKIPSKDIDRFTAIMSNAYPAMGCHVPSEQDRLKKKLRTDDKLVGLGNFGMYDQGHLIGGLRLFDFWGRLFESRILYGGGGSLAVDLAHKKEKVARDLMLYFLRYFRDRKSPVAALYPFRPDFYRRMGFGYGVKINEYKVRPSDLPDSGSKAHLATLSPDDISDMIACFNRIAKTSHGMFEKHKYELSRYKNPAVRIIGYWNKKKLEGYMTYTFKRGSDENFVLNDLVVGELCYEHPGVLAELMTFLHTQADQVRHAVFQTSDDFFHFLPFDPRDGSDRFVGVIAQQTNRQGVALMYRVINLPELFRKLKNHSFGDHTMRLRINLRDSFLPENDGSYLISFTKGKPSVLKSGRANLEIGLDVSNFSSLVMGTVDFFSLCDYGLAEISDRSKVRDINRLFAVDRPPVCYTQF